MQNSELYRRGVVLPLDADAEDRLRRNDVSERTNVRCLKIPGTEAFDSIRQVGLLREINANCSALLDDYEEEIIESSSAEGIIRAVDQIAQEAKPCAELIVLIEQLRDLAQHSIITSRPLWFIL